MAQFKIRDKETGEVFTVREKEPIPTMAKPREAFGMDLPEDFKQQHPYLSAGYETLKEGVALPALGLLDVASLGAISGAARKAGEVLPSAKTTPGRALELGAKGVGLFKSPILKAIGGIKIPGLKEAVEAKNISRPLAGAITGATRGAVAGAAVSPYDITDVGARGKQALGAGAVGGVIGAGIGTVESILAARPEKVNQIREGMKGWWKSTSKEYGRLMKQAGIEGGEIDPVDTLDFMEKELVTKGVLDRGGNVIAPAQDKVDRALLKGYERLRDEFLSSGGKVPATEVVGAARTVEAGGRRVSRFKPTQLGSEARRLKTGIEETFKANLRNQGKSFEEANKLWGKMREGFDAVDEKFNTWGNNIATGKGERSLSRIMSSGEMRNIAKVIEQQTGVNLTTDKILSVITSPAIRNTARTLGIIGAIIYGLRSGRGAMIPTQAR